MDIWNGLTPNRQDLGTAKAAGYEDYLVIVQKIQELQTFVLNWTDNIELMPNLKESLHESQDKINQIQELIAKISLPQDVKSTLENISQFVEDVDQRIEVNQLRRDLEILREQVARNQIEVLELQGSFATEVKGFQNKVWGLLEKLQKETSVKIAILEEKVTHVDAQLEVQSSIEKFARLKNK